METPQTQQFQAALVQVALSEAKEISVRMAETIAFLQRSQHLAALGTLQGMGQQFRLLEAMLEAAARLPK
jgi:hypothetical protein